MKGGKHLLRGGRVQHMAQHRPCAALALANKVGGLYPAATAGLKLSAR